MACAPQLDRQASLSIRPPAPGSSDDYERPLLEDRFQSLDAVAAKVNLYSCFHRTRLGDLLESPLAKIDQDRWAFERERVRYYLGHHQGDSRTQPIRKRSCPFERGNRR